MAAVKSITSPMKFLIQAGLLADLGKHIKLGAGVQEQIVMYEYRFGDVFRAP